ncbi:helix-turn-helix transcriptional regulator [Streptomyces sp. SCSIO ZS0520]|uniref:helix-turn-helix transcriptional regulator n=1 Tax=Streptomyces sp. SCSIO ZS0520 TaxID=2892996 RepID=UPI0021DA4284|nr:helix-turn-helix transcriptional regulator [Streptomyces sp. SCSIO ZS0520]
MTTTARRSAPAGTAPPGDPARSLPALTPAPAPALSDASAPVPAAETDPAPRPEAEIRRHELAAFLRSRRERISPEQVGLPRGRRRRTPGLRREEVAQLSTVGVTWYTWLEQARDIQVSAQVLDALARTLLLDATERGHLFALAAVVDPAPGTPCPSVTPALRLLLEQLEPVPACIQNSRYDILAYNRTYGRLLCDLDRIPPEDRNCMVLCFTNEEWRSSLVLAEETSRVMAAKFRVSMAGHLAEPAWKVLLHRLTTSSPEFRAAWARHEVVGQHSKTKQFRNALVGLVSLVHTDLWLGPSGGPRMVTYPPADEESRTKLERLHALAVAGS